MNVVTSDKVTFANVMQIELTDDCIKKLADALKQKTGKWIAHDCLGQPSIDNDVCSACGTRFYQIAETGCIWNYCPNCGARMVGEEE